ncbi:unnamed protein product [Protopolystoma xenopodis]|uniref:Uncharacterized protein n=1 Tax=Protopolystoma xenopodis TaxID=117903 RepID=A0A3S5BMX9_9PLAT|nr:unnamed protein product [Protopolystoma xenopodis]
MCLMEVRPKAKNCTCTRELVTLKCKSCGCNRAGSTKRECLGDKFKVTRTISELDQGGLCNKFCISIVRRKNLIQPYHPFGLFTQAQLHFGPCIGFMGTCIVTRDRVVCTSL